MKLTTKLAYKLFPSYIWSAMRFEWFIHTCNRQIKSSVNRKKIAAVQQQNMIQLHVGCGKRIMEGWVNVDIFKAAEIDFQLNLRNPIPLRDNSVDLLYSEHVLEHFFKPEAINILKEFYRIAKPGATLRIGVPDAAIYIKKYIENDRAFFEAIRHLGGAVIPLSTPIDVINQMFRMGGAHLFAWDFETLAAALEQAGFRNIQQYPSGVCSSPKLNLDDPAHAFETLYIESTK